MLEVKNLTKIYKPKKGVPVKALDGVDLNIEENGMVFILGKSGSGKSTLLNLLGGLDKYDGGEIIIKGKSSKDFSQAEFDSYRNTYVGFIFQEYNILNEFSVGANIALAMELQGKKATPEALNKLLEMVDLSGYASRKPNELSGGQKQRVAIARALIKEPEIIMADEPTGALDSNTGKQVFETLKKLSKDKLVLIVSHDREFAEYYGDRVIELADGKIISDISKYKAQSETKSEGVSIIDEKILHVKQGYQLTEADLTLINNYLKKNTNDTIISVDSSANLDFRKLARIDDEGNRDAFAETADETLNIKKYNESDFKLIKSKLPPKNAFRIGASGLKAKPFRLFMTILLSAIAFALFGLADTMGSYDKVNATVSSIMDSNINYVAISKEMKISQDNNSYYYFNSAKIGDADLAKIKAEFPDMTFISVFTGSSNYGGNFSINDFKDNSKFPNSYMNFYSKSFSGFAEVTESDLSRLGFTLVDGSSFPTADNEIIITGYMYDHFKLAGYKSPTSSPADDLSPDAVTPATLMGKTLSIYIDGYYANLKIVGIANTNLDDTRYAAFKSTENTSDGGIGDYMLYSEFQEMLNYGPHALCFTRSGFIEANFDTSFIGSYNVYANAYYMQAYGITDGNYYYPSLSNLYSVNKLNTDYLVMLGSNTLAGMGANDVIIDLNSLNNFCNLSLNNSYYANEIAAIAREYAVDALNADSHALDDFIAFTNTTDYPISDPDNVEEVLSSYEYYHIMLCYGYVFEGNTDFLHPLSFYSTLFFEDLIKEINPASLSQLTFQVTDYHDFAGGNVDVNFNIVGVYMDTSTSYSLMPYFTAAGFSSFNVELEENFPYSFVLSEMPTDENMVRKIVLFTYGDEENDNIFYPLRNSVMSTLGMVNNLIENLAQVFLYIGLGFAVFASFLMLNFIATSISYKKREIGILRAVGARSTDVFGIFFSESFLIAVINWSIALVLTIATTIYLNGMLRTDYNMQITLLNFGIRQIALIFGVSLFVAFIASLLPVQKIARKKPIDAIQNR